MGVPGAADLHRLEIGEQLETLLDVLRDRILRIGVPGVDETSLAIDALALEVADLVFRIFEAAG